MLVVLGFASFSFGQKIHSFMRPIDSLDSVKKGTFSSTEAGFSVALPKQLGGFSGITGIEYKWRLKEGFYVVGIVDKEAEIENSAKFEEETLQILEKTFLNFAREYFATKADIIKGEKKPFEYQGHKGIEVRTELTNSVCIIRVFWIKNRAYKVGVLLAEGQENFEGEAQKVFDSLKVFAKDNIDEKIRKKIEENTPKPLPQTPVVETVKSDAEDENLKGKVESVTQESQFTKGDKAGNPKQKDFEDFYNEAGNLIKKVSYDDTNGYPFQITVYGYINQSRVSNSSFIQYENSLSGIVVEESSAITKKRDLRYDYKYVNKYDTNKNLIEQILYDNAGILWTKTVYKRNGDSVEEILYHEDKINMRSVSKIDDKGNKAESSYFDSPMQGWTTSYSYKYEEFDKMGNWIKRVNTQSQTFKGITKEKWTMIEYRTITYY